MSFCFVSLCFDSLCFVSTLLPLLSTLARPICSLCDGKVVRVMVMVVRVRVMVVRVEGEG